MSENGKKIKIYNTDKVDADLENYCDEVQNGAKKKKIEPLVITAAVLGILILGVVLYWSLHIAGLL